MSDLGARLKHARQERGISLRDIATTSKISVVALEALEKNDYSRLPGGIFSRAFVRAYATAVGLDPEEAVAEFLAEFTRYQREKERQKKRPEISVDDRQFLERQRTALRTLRTVLLVAAVATLVGLVYVAWLWWPAGGSG
jgi:cytoskeletal protein RodZ